MLVYKNYPPAPEKKFPHFFFKVWTSLINQYEFLLILSLSKAALRIQKKPILRSYAGCVIWNKIILRKLYFVYARNENYNNKQYSEQKEVFTSLSQNFEAKRSVVMKSFLQIDLYVTRIAIKHSDQYPRLICQSHSVSAAVPSVGNGNLSEISNNTLFIS